MYTRLKNNIFIRNSIIDEFSKIRHDYNNIFQTVINLIEAEDLEELIKNKSTLLKKTDVCNHNSITQLGKLKAETILNTVHRLYINTIKDDIILQIKVYNHIKREFPREEELYPLLKECLRLASSVTDQENPVISLEIMENDKGQLFRFECRNSKAKENVIPNIEGLEKLKMRDIITYNTHLINQNYIQELMICY
jgi:hypothetical protein